MPWLHCAVRPCMARIPLRQAVALSLSTREAFASSRPSLVAREYGRRLLTLALKPPSSRLRPMSPRGRGLLSVGSCVFFPDSWANWPCRLCRRCAAKGTAKRRHCDGDGCVEFHRNDLHESYEVNLAVPVGGPDASLRAAIGRIANLPCRRHSRNTALVPARAWASQGNASRVRSGRAARVVARRRKLLEEMATESVRTGDH